MQSGLFYNNERGCWAGSKRINCYYQNCWLDLDFLPTFNFLQEYLAQDQYQVGLNLTNWQLWVVFNVNINIFFQIAAYQMSNIEYVQKPEITRNIATNLTARTTIPPIQCTKQSQIKVLRYTFRFQCVQNLVPSRIQNYYLLQVFQRFYIYYFIILDVQFFQVDK
ncbi:Hypothetical_protein [Hexamita inflata]|uniref:Hypothetical_protein n=1 Tax=Hexamita inflata TaxID=28002 RepID=A0AA86R7L4_9EUKA|nr:Hypothetical protein HINF_LOCUS59735 [Hexamita inflata]